MEALRGRSPDGKTGVDPKDLTLVGHELGFRAEMLIEDTHTSIELFRQVSGFLFGCVLGWAVCRRRRLLFFVVVVVGFFGRHGKHHMLRLVCVLSGIVTFLVVVEDGVCWLVGWRCVP